MFLNDDTVPQPGWLAFARDVNEALDNPAQVLRDQGTLQKTQSASTQSASTAKKKSSDEIDTLAKYRLPAVIVVYNNLVQARENVRIAKLSRDSTQHTFLVFGL